MTDATAHWTALGKWTPSFFKEHYGSVSLTIDGEPHTMASFIDLVLSSPSREKIGSQILTQGLSFVPKTHLSLMIGE